MEVLDVEVCDGDGKLKVCVKQMFVFLKQGGVWKLYCDMWNVYLLVKD